MSNVFIIFIIIIIIIIAHVQSITFPFLPTVLISGVRHGSHGR